MPPIHNGRVTLGARTFGRVVNGASAAAADLQPEHAFRQASRQNDQGSRTTKIPTVSSLLPSICRMCSPALSGKSTIFTMPEQSAP